jgi:LSD1 subclass zinc finger protein
MAAIERATAQLRSLHEQRERATQLTRKAAATGLVETLRVWNGVIALGGGLAVAVFVTLLFMDSPRSPAMVGFCSGPLLLLFPMVLSAVLFTRHAHSRPVAMPTVLPPEAAGAPLRCHLCGAPVQVTPGAATVRCGFCQTDNVVDERALAPQQLVAISEAQHAGEVTAFAHALERRSFSARRGLFFASVAAVLVGPPVGCVLGMLFSALVG